MARGFQFDTYDQAKIEARRASAQPARRLDPKTAPGPKVEECCECGDTIGPWWGEDGEVFCRRHAPLHLRKPGTEANAS